MVEKRGQFELAIVQHIVQLETVWWAQIDLFAAADLLPSCS